MNNNQVEFATINSIVNSHVACLEAISLLEEGDFTNELCRKAFSIILDLVNDGAPVDDITVKTKGGPKFADSFDKYIAGIGKPENYIKYFADLKELSKYTKAKDILEDSLAHISVEGADVSDIVSKTEEKLIGLMSNREYNKFSFIGDEIKDAINRVKNPQSDEGSYIKTGLNLLDEKLIIDRNGYVIIAARPSVGKTALALQIAKHIAVDKGDDVLIFSIEMPKRKIAGRILSNTTEIPLWKIIKAKGFSQTDWKQYEKYKDKFESSKGRIHINDSASIDIASLAALAKMRCIQYPNIKAIIVDYIQLMTHTNDLNVEVGHISKILKSLSRTLNRPVIALSQLSRKCDDRIDKRPMLSDLRDSGGIEQDADVVMFIYRSYVYTRNEEEKDICEIIIGKNREGETFTHHCLFNGEIQKFIERPII